MLAADAVFAAVCHSAVCHSTMIGLQCDMHHRLPRGSMNLEVTSQCDCWLLQKT